MKTLTTLLALLLFTTTALAEHDLVIRNGRIIDGAGNAWFIGDIAIDGGKVTAVGAVDSKGKQEIEAKGLVVAPGFIDVHTHADEDVIRQPKAENFIRDGVTTIVTGNCGGSVTDVGGYFAQIREKGTAINTATLIGHNSVLRKVKGNKAGELTPEQMEQAKQLVKQAMLDGAVGMSTGLIYTPGQWSKTEEIIELQKVAAAHGGIYASHMRSEGSGILDAIDEALWIGREAQSRVEISHFKLPADIAGKIGGSDATLGKVAAARAAGMEVWLDQYPYTASSTSISTMLPDWVLEDGAEEAKKKLTDEKQLARVLESMKQSYEVQRPRKSLAYAVIASCKAYPNYVGRNVHEIAQMMKLKKEKGSDVELLSEKPEKLPPVSMEEQYRAVIDIYLAGGAGCVFHTMNETEVENILRHPLVSVASDSGIRDFGRGQPHPRGYGTNARVLGVYVRERKVISLEDAIRKMTSQPATAFRMRDRGLLRDGFAADIVIFDPDTVIDKATFDQPHAYAEGFRYVIVNGKVVLNPEGMTDARPGQPVLGSGVRPR
jgi:N-acyl-D-amino-acid deacylase